MCAVSRHLALADGSSYGQGPARAESARGADPGRGRPNRYPCAYRLYPRERQARLSRVAAAGHDKVEALGRHYRPAEPTRRDLYIATGAAAWWDGDWPTVVISMRRRRDRRAGARWSDLARSPKGRSSRCWRAK